MSHSLLKPLSRRGSIWSLWLAASIGLLLAGCSKEAKQVKHGERAEEFFVAGEYDRAEIEYLNVLQANPKDSHALSRLGRIYFEQGKLGRAFPLLAGIKELAPDNLDNRVKLSQFNLAAGRRKEAIEEATFVLSKRPDDVESILVLGEASVLPDQIKSSRALLQALTPTNTTGAPILTALAFLSAREGDAATAERLVNEALAKDPKLASAHSGAALLALSKGNIPAADAAFGKASEFSKPRSRERLQYASFKLQIGDAAAGKRLLEAITKETPDYLPALIRQIELAGNEKRLEDAAALLKSVQSRDPNNPEALLAAAKLALVGGDPARSLVESEKLIKLYPQLAPAHFEAARAHLATFAVDKAIESLNRALQLAPDYPEASLLLANLNLRNGNNSIAITALRQLIAKRPGLLDAQVLLAGAYRTQGEPGPALEIYNRILGTNPTNDRIALLKGATLLEAKKLDEAREVFEAVLKRTPGSDAAIEQLTGLDVALKKPDQARARLESAKTALPNSANLRIISAQLYFAVGKPDQAVEELRKAIELQPEQMIAQGLLARHYMNSGAPDKALENLRLVVEQNPRDFGAWTLAALIHEQRQDWPRAREAYEKVLSITPRSYKIQNNLAVILGEYLGELDRAIELAKAARESAPTDEGVADTLGWLLYKRGEYVQAVRLLRESADRMPDSAEVKYHLGMAQYAVGDDAGATASLEAATEKDPKAKWVPEARRRISVLRTTAPATPQQMADLRALVEATPSDTIAWSRLADLQEYQGDKDAALVTREKLVKLNPQNGKAIFALAKLYKSRGEKEKALAATRDARRLAPEDSEIALELARLSLEARDFPGALVLLQESARNRPTDASVYYDLGTASLAMARVDEARTAWRRALELESLASQAPGTRERLTLLDALSAAAPSPTVVSLARRRLETQPDDLASLAVVARVNQAAGDSSGTRSVLEKTVSLYPDYLPARRALILLLAEDPANDRKTAELSTPAREVLALDREANRALGLVAHRLGDHRRAVTLLEASLRQSPDDAIALLHLGLSQQALKELDASRSSLQKAMAKGLSGDAAAQARKALDTLGK